jgi:predicted RNA binding protein YcfA (HicA-like mRNA interferase family)
MGDGFGGAEILLCITSELPAVLEFFGWRCVMQRGSHEGDCAVTATVMETKRFGVVNHHPGTTDHGDGGAAGKTGLTRRNASHTHSDQSCQSRVEKLRPFLRLNPPGEWESGDIDGG